MGANYTAFFPVSCEATTSDLEMVAREWLIGSPHSTIDSDEIEAHLGDLEWRVSTESESVVALSAEDDGSLVGVRYEKYESARRWVTEVVGLKGRDNFFVSVKVSSDSNSPGDSISDARKPYVIKLILERLGGGVDGGLEVLDKPHLLGTDEVDRARALLVGETQCVLPIVYISAYGHGDHPIDPGRIANRLSGAAHVVVEPNREFSFRLRDSIRGKNAYDGAIAVHWPLASSRDIVLPSRLRHDRKDIELAITQKVRDGLNAFRLPHRCSWANLQQIQSRRAIAKLRESGSSEIEDYIAQFEPEIEAKNSEIAQLESENAKLRISLTEAERVQQVGGLSSFLERGREQEFYSGEHRDIILRILRDAVNQQKSDSRRSHLLTDLLDSNDSAGVIDDRRKRLKSALDNYQSLDQKVRRTLEELGFSITSDGKHHKLKYYDDLRYGFTLSKTSSEHRSGKNLVSDISGKIF